MTRASVSPHVVGEALVAGRSPLVISHTSPDFDAHGSALSIWNWFVERGIAATYCNESPTAPRYGFLPGIDAVRHDIPESLLSQSDLVVVCDCGDAKRIGDSFYERVIAHPHVVSIDHHVSNTLFGALNLVETVSSTAELVFEVLSSVQYVPSKNVATTLFAGISGDTGSFRYKSTSPRTLRIAATLLECGADIEDISRRLYASRPKRSVEIASYVLQNLRYFERELVAIGVVSQETYDRYGADIEDTEGLAEEIRTIEGVVIAVLIYRFADFWKVSLRSKDTRVDLSVIAKLFGGGGHRAAAAFRWRGTEGDLEEELLPHLITAVAGLPR